MWGRPDLSFSHRTGRVPRPVVPDLFSTRRTAPRRMDNLGIEARMGYITPLNKILRRRTRHRTHPPLLRNLSLVRIIRRLVRRYTSDVPSNHTLQMNLSQENEI